MHELPGRDLRCLKEAVDPADGVWSVFETHGDHSGDEDAYQTCVDIY